MLYKNHTLTKFTLVFLSCLAVTACNGFIGSHEYKFGRDKISPGYFDPDEEKASKMAVATYPSYAAAAISSSETKDKDGTITKTRVCAQTAQSAKARGDSNIAKLDVPIEKMPVSVAVNQAVNEAVMALQEKNSAATTADVMMFHLCEIAINNNLSQEQIVQSINYISNTVSAVAQANAAHQANYPTNITAQAEAKSGNDTKPQSTDSNKSVKTK